MVTNYTVDGYTPVDSTLYTTPIQVTGHTVHNLTVARTPSGQAVFGWSSGGIYYCHVDPDFNTVYQNDVCADGSERVVFNNLVEGWTVSNGSIWVDRGQLFCAIKLLFFNLGISICYVADDVENPTTWIERGVISSEQGELGSTDIESAGPPLVLTTGRWVLPFAVWRDFAGIGAEDGSGISISDDRGVTWTVAYSHRRSPGAGGTTGPIADTIGQDPLTGYLWWSHYDGPVANQGFILRSIDSGTSWVVVDTSASQSWNFMVDDGAALLYATGQGVGEWTIYNTNGDPGNQAGFIDTTFASIPSRQSTANFQSHVFLDHGSIAFVDENRISGYFFPPQGCPIPDPLHIPYKDRLLRLELDEDGKPLPRAYDLMSDHDFDNLKEIERWAARWMTDSRANHGAPDSCELFIPFKDHLRHAGQGGARLSSAVQRAMSSMSFENYKVIERWALRVTGGECACVGPSKCLLHIPWKDAAFAIVVTDDGSYDNLAAMEAAGQQDFDNYKTIERWANMNARGECGDGGGFPPTPFPPPPASPARLIGELLEVAAYDNRVARLAGEMLEISVQDPGVARLLGEMMEVSTQDPGVARLTGEMMEVAIVV